MAADASKEEGAGGGEAAAAAAAAAEPVAPAVAPGCVLRVSMRLSNEMPEFVVVTSKFDEAMTFNWRSEMHIQMAFMEEPGACHAVPYRTVPYRAKHSVVDIILLHMAFA